MTFILPDEALPLPSESDMNTEQRAMFNSMSATQKADGLRRAGWVPAGSGDGPVGESEWWPPACLAHLVPEMTCDFDRAVSVTVGEYRGLEAA